jgi:hypothetical protein
MMVSFLKEILVAEAEEVKTGSNPVEFMENAIVPKVLFRQ